MTPRATLVFRALLVLGLVVRLVLVVAVKDIGIHTDDERDYTELAASIAAGDGFAFAGHRITSIRPPLYPAFVASVWTAAGSHNLQAVRVAQIALAIGSAWFVFLLARDMFDAATARWAALAWWWYPSFLYAGVLVLTEVLFTFWLLAGTVAAVRGAQRQEHSAWWAIAAGASIGLAALTRSIVWPLPIVLAPMLILFGGGRWRRRAVTGAALVAGYVAIVGPWAYRNTTLQQTLVIVDTMGGLNLRMGNYEYTLEDRMWDAVSLKGEKSWSYRLVLEHPDATHWTEGQRERWARDQAVEYIRAHPLTTLRRGVLKFADFWGLEREYIAALRDGKYRPPLWFAVVSSGLILVTYVVVVMLATVGLVNSRWTDWKPHALALLMILWICGLHSVVFGHSRYHLPVMPLVLVYSVAAIRQSTWSFAGVAAWRRVAAIALGVMFAAIWAHEVLQRDFDRILQLAGPR